MIFQTYNPRMRVAASIFWIAWFLAPAANAREKWLPSQHAPSLLSAVVSSRLRARIERVMFHGEVYDSEEQQYIVRMSSVEPVSLGPGEERALLVRGGGGFCGATGNCAIWVFDPVDGAVLLNQGLGYRVVLSSAVHQGHYDIVITSNLSCCSGLHDTYRFDGKTYVKFKTVPYGH